jgi:hypothetical protein
MAIFGLFSTVLPKEIGRVMEADEGGGGGTSGTLTKRTAGRYDDWLGGPNIFSSAVGNITSLSNNPITCLPTRQGCLAAPLPTTARLTGCMFSAGGSGCRLAVCVGVRARVRACVCTCWCANAHALRPISTLICMCVRMPAHTHTHAHTCTHARTHACTRNPPLHMYPSWLSVLCGLLAVLWSVPLPQIFLHAFLLIIAFMCT